MDESRPLQRRIPTMRAKYRTENKLSLFAVVVLCTHHNLYYEGVYDTVHISSLYGIRTL